MAFQSIINQFQAPGIPGEFADNSPRTVQPAILNGADDALPTIGRVFTYTAPTTDPMQVTLGGAAANFAGILVNPKELVRANGLTAGLEVTEGSIGSICREGHIWVKVDAAVTLSSIPVYNTTTGTISGYTGETVPSGYAAIPNAKFVLVNSAADGMAVLELNR